MPIAGIVRTSTIHPLLIAEIPAGPQIGRVGATFCPGKKQASVMTGCWERDLDTDMAAIASWGAVLVVTLVEKDELTSLGVETLGAMVAQHRMD